MSKFFRDTGYLGVGLVLSGLGGLIMNIGLGRVLPGSQYGIYRIFFSSVLLSGWIMAFGIERNITAKTSSKDTTTSKEIDKSLTALISVFLLFFLLAFVLKGFIIEKLQLEIMYFYYIIAAAVFAFFRYITGIMKGKRIMKIVGIQNVLLGIGKFSILGLAIYLGWKAPQLGLAIIILFGTISALSALWIRDLFKSFRLHIPDLQYYKNILFSTSKQIGEVGVRIGGPIVVTVLGGTSFDSGVFGAMLTLSNAPYFGYRAIFENMLPEVSELNSQEKYKELNKKVSFLTELTLIFLVLWVAIGYFSGPYLLKLIYKPSFIISNINSAFIFLLGGGILLSALFTEILIGLGNEKAVAKGWIYPALILPLFYFYPSKGIDIASKMLASYNLLVTVLLGYELYKNQIDFHYTGLNYQVFMD